MASTGQQDQGSILEREKENCSITPLTKEQPSQSSHSMLNADGREASGTPLRRLSHLHHLNSV